MVFKDFQTRISSENEFRKIYICIGEILLIETEKQNLSKYYFWRVIAYIFFVFHVFLT